MQRLDLFLQRARIRRAVDRVDRGAKVLDIGCHEGELGRALEAVDCDYFGSDSTVAHTSDRLAVGHFPDDLPPTWITGDFDHLVALAVLEHVPADRLHELFSIARRCLRPGGTFIATVPSPVTDHVLDALSKLRLIDGMDLDAHDGLTIDELKVAAAAAGLQLSAHQRFQFGFNNSLVWSRLPDD